MGADYKNLSDIELAELLNVSDESAFNEIYKRFFGVLYIFLFKRLMTRRQRKT